MGIIKDFKTGKDGEEKLGKLLKKWGYSVEYNNDINHDILAEKKKLSVKFEVKNDVMAAKTGNWAIEIWNTRQNKASGVSATKAEIWAHIDGDEIWITKTQALKSYINKEKGRVIQNVGDGNATIQLYSRDVLIEGAGFILLKRQKQLTEMINEL